MPGSVYKFGTFQLDCGRFELLRNGHALHVERKPMELLILLASHQGQLVSRAEIAQFLWSSEVFVDTEHGINTAIRKLRQVLRDDAESPQFIQTVTGMGYRFVAPVTGVSPRSAGETESTSHQSPSVPLAAPRRQVLGWYLAAGICAVVALGGTGVYRLRYRSQEIEYTQLTDLTDSAVQPALSPDGHMVAFIRSSNTFLTSDQIYAMMLPNGEAKRLTEDNRPKYGLAFSPDGSEVAYTVLEGPTFSTYEVSVLGGEPQLLQKNAAGLVWLNPQRLLFSEAPSGIHLGVVSATLTREDLRQIYLPAHERGMAHFSFPSPNRQWALVVEMNGNGDWAPCRLVALEGQHQSRTVGPDGACTSAGWSPDGHWMYFTAAVRGQSHIWQQRFPEGEPEQVTYGPTEEEGLAVEPSGHSMITSLGVHESAIWIHDPAGDRSLSSEGEVLWSPSPIFSPDAKTIYYALRRWGSSATELWRTSVDSGKSEAVFPGVSISGFDLSPDGKQIVYTTGPLDATAELWLAPVDRSSPPIQIPVPGARSPRFGAQGQILFQLAKGTENYLEQVNPDGTHLSRVLPYPILEFQDISPARRWVTLAITQQNNSPAMMEVPLDGGAPRRIRNGYCVPRWSTNGNFLYVPVDNGSRNSPGRTLAIPIGPGETLPAFPAEGIAPMAEPSVVRGAQSVPRSDFIPGADPEHYAWVNTTAHRNLYRISLP